MLMSTDLIRAGLPASCGLRPPLSSMPGAVADHAVGARAVGQLEVTHRVAHLLVELGLLDRRAVRVLRRHVEPLPEQRHLLMLDAELEQRAVGNE